MPNPVRRLSVPPLAGLEGQGSGSVRGGGPQGVVSHSPPPASSVYGTHPHAFVCPYFHQGGCSRGGHPGVDCQGCCGACSSSLFRLLQPPVKASSGGVSSGSCASGILSLPALCGSWSHLPIQSVVLRSVHGPAGLHSGYGSCVRYSSFLGYPYASLSGRLARPGRLSGILGLYCPSVASWGS